MANILDFGEKRIHELTPLNALNDDAILLIGQNSLTYKVSLLALQKSFASDNPGDIDKFYNIEEIEKKIDNINDNISSMNDTLNKYGKNINTAISDLASFKGEISGILSEFDLRIITAENAISGFRQELIDEFARFNSQIAGQFASIRNDLDSTVDSFKKEVNNNLNKMDAQIEYIYAYGPVVPTILPEGKFFLQTFNENYKWEVNNDVAKPAIYKDENNNEIESPVQILLSIQQVGEKIARISMAFNGELITENSSSVKVTLLDDYVYSSAGFNIYTGNTSDWSNLNEYQELGIFVIPTTSTQISVEIGAGIFNEPITVVFTDIDDGIWASFTGILVIPLTMDGNYLYYKDANGEPMFLTAGGSSEENPRGSMPLT